MSAKKIYLPAPALMELLLGIAGERGVISDARATLERETGLVWSMIWRPLKWLEARNYVVVKWHRRGHKYGAGEIRVLKREISEKIHRVIGNSRGELSDEVLNSFDPEVDEVSRHLQLVFFASILRALLELFVRDSDFPQEPHFHDLVGGVREKIEDKFGAFWNERHIKGVLTILVEGEYFKTVASSQAKNYYALAVGRVQQLEKAVSERVARERAKENA
jgi:hypothetical protein